jgi:shikimate dehydrogenase
MLKRISGKTNTIALLGSPVSHSKSPSIQNGCFEALGLDYVYIAFDVKLNDLAAAIQGVRALHIWGCNVTMPLKKAICKHLDRLTPAAEMAGAVNVIVNDDGVLTGHITDGEGFMLSLQDSGVAYINQKITLLGAGGASTAVAIQAALEGVLAISIFNQQDEFFLSAQQTAAMLKERFKCQVQIFDLNNSEAMRQEIASSDILINATSVGMEGTLEQCLVPDASYFHSQLVVCDLIYVPAETTLLKIAKAAGCKTISGLGMQLFQGVSAFEMWTGHKMPMDVARQILFHKPTT